MSSDNKVAIYHRPDWHPNLSQVIGDIIGEAGYVTEMGTIKVLGPIFNNPNFDKYKSKSEINGPTIVLTAKSSLGFA